MPLKQVATSGEKKREREKDREMTDVGFIRTGFRDLKKLMCFCPSWFLGANSLGEMSILK